MTLRRSRERRLPCAARKRSPWRRKMSATSSFGRIPPGSFGRDDHEREPVEGARRVGDQMGGDLRVARGRGKIGMSEQHLNDAKLDATFEKVRRKAVAQAMGRDGFAEPDLAARDPTSVLQCGHADMLAGLPTGKQPQAGTRSLPIQPLPRGARSPRVTERAGAFPA